MCYLPAFLCNEDSGCPVPSLLHPRNLTLVKLKGEAGWPHNGVMGLASLRVTAWVLLYYFSSLVLQAALPGVVAQGVKLRSGARLEYKFNGGLSLYAYFAILLILLSFQLCSDCTRNSRHRHCSAGRRLLTLDLYLGQLRPAHYGQFWHRIFARVLCLLSKLFCQTREQA